MIGQPRLVLVTIAVALFAAVHVVLAVAHEFKVTDPVPYYVALGLSLASCAAVFAKPTGRLPRVLAVTVTAAVLAASLLVVSVLIPGLPSYAMWYPSLIAAPMSAVVLRGHPALGVVGAVGSAIVTLLWSGLASGQGVDGWVEALYRVTTPTAAVVLCVGIAALMRTSRIDVERAHAERIAAGRFAAAVRAGDLERADRLADVSRLAGPVLTRLTSGQPPGRRLVAECRLLEATLRDGIRGRGLVDAAVAAGAWAARARGVRVVLLDDAGSSPVGHRGPAGADPAGRALLRRVLVGVIESVSRGTVTARLWPQPDAVLGTVVVVSEEAPAAAATAVGLPRVTIDVSKDEAIVTVVALPASA